MSIQPLVSELHRMISRLSREKGSTAEMAALGEAMARLQLLERSVRDLLALMADTPYPEVLPAIQRAKELVGGQ